MSIYPFLAKKKSRKLFFLVLFVDATNLYYFEAGLNITDIGRGRSIGPPDCPEELVSQRTCQMVAEEYQVGSSRHAPI